MRHLGYPSDFPASSTYIQRQRFGNDLQKIKSTWTLSSFSHVTTLPHLPGSGHHQDRGSWSCQKPFLSILRLQPLLPKNPSVTSITSSPADESLPSAWPFPTWPKLPPLLRIRDSSQSTSSGNQLSAESKTRFNQIHTPLEH